jgi:YVTN family beta-propeller protein
VTAAILAALAAVAPPPPLVHAAAVQVSPVSLSVLAPRARRLTCAVDGGTPRTCARTASLRLPPGRHRITVRAVDAAGRSSAGRSVVVVVARPAPAPVRVGAQPVGVAAVGETVWVSNSASGTVSRIDSRSRRVVAEVQVGGQLGSVAAAADDVWVSVFGGGELVRIDPARNAVAGRIAVGGRPTGIAVGPDGDIWVGNLDGYVSRVDPASGTVRRIALPSGASMPLVARGLVWLGLQSGAVVSIDPATNGLAGAAIRVAPDVDALVDTRFGIWVSTFAGTAALVDPDRRVVARRLRLPSRGGGIALAGGSVWASAYDSGLVVRLDPRSGAVLAAVQTGSRPRESVAAGGSLWVLDQGDGTVTPIPLG